MTLKTTVYIGACTLVSLLALFAVFLANNRLAHADSLAEEINCEVYAQLVAQGAPIPPGFETACGGEGDIDENETPVDPCDIINQNPLVPDCDEDTDTGGGGDGGGTGGSGAACSDTLDNDNDGLTDLSDPGCTGADDTDETDPSTGGGSGGTDGGSGNGGGGSSGGTGGSTGGGTFSGGSTATSTGETLGAATSTIACDQYLTHFLKFGAKNDEEQVKRLQHVLKNFEGAPIEESGMFDEATLSAVHAFQTKYWDSILAPWNLKQSTGYVYLTTRKKVNEIYCDHGVMFPLTAEENTLIESTKKMPVHTSAHTSVPAAATKPDVKRGDVIESPATSESEESEPVTRRSSIRGFFQRLIDWVR